MIDSRSNKLSSSNSFLISFERSENLNKLESRVLLCAPHPSYDFDKQHKE